MQTLVASWHSAKVVRTRDKVTFFLGVMSLLVSAFLFGLAPQCVPFHIFRLPEAEVLCSDGSMLHIPYKA